MEEERLPGLIRAGRSRELDAGGETEATCGLEEQAQVFRHVLGGGVPLRSPLRERLLADAFQFLGDRVVDLAGWASLSLGHLLDDLRKRITPEWSSPR